MSLNNDDGDESAPLLLGGSKKSAPPAPSSGSAKASKPDAPVDPFLASESRHDFLRRQRSLRVVLLTNFLSAVGFSVLMSTLWPYLHRMGGKKEFLGYIVGAFSIGQLFGAPFFGYWFNHINPKKILIFAIIMRICGNIGYAFAGSVPGHKEWFLFEVRMLVGFGAGSMAVCMSYTSEATTMSERTAYMSNIAASGGLGFIVGPMMGMTFSKLKPGIVAGDFVLDFLTGPAYMAASLAVINLLLVVFFFHDLRIKRTPPPATKSRSNSSGSINTVPKAAIKPYRDNVAVAAIMFCYFLGCVTLAVFETVATPMTMDEYNWNAQQGDVYNGIIGGLGGAVSVGAFLITKPLSARFGLRPLLVVSAVVMVLGNILFIPFAGKPPVIWHQTDDDDPSSAHGCRAKWCETIPQLPFIQMCIATFILCVSNPICTVMCFTLYSMVLGPFPQGLWMGLLNGCGSLARAFGPLVISNLYANYGPRTVYAFVAGMDVLVILCVVIFYKRMIPHELFLKR